MEPRGALRGMRSYPMLTTAMCSSETIWCILRCRCIVEDVLEHNSIVVVWFANFFPAFWTSALEKARCSKERMQAIYEKYMYSTLHSVGHETDSTAKVCSA